MIDNKSKDMVDSYHTQQYSGGCTSIMYQTLIGETDVLKVMDDLFKGRI